MVRLQSLLYTLEVNGRWDGDLVEERLRPKVEMLRLHGWQDNGQIDEVKLREGLETAVATLSRFIGREPGNVAVLAYARWLKSDVQGQQEWLAVLEEVLHH